MTSKSSFEKKLVYSPSQKSLTDTLWVLVEYGDPDSPTPSSKV